MKSDLQIAAEAVERERQGLSIRALVPSDQSLEAEALADDMNSRDRQRYIEILCEGMPCAQAASFIQAATKLTPKEWRLIQDIRCRLRPPLTIAQIDELSGLR